jgi:hypothetical protein
MNEEARKIKRGRKSTEFFNAVEPSFVISLRSLSPGIRASSPHPTQQYS